MNSLNLRVSSVKTGENIRKNAEMRTSPVVLSKYLEDDGGDNYKKFSEAKSIPEQVAVIKKIFLSTDDTASTENIQFLSDLYFYSPLKHPVRNQCYKFLQQTKNKMISKSLIKSIKKLLSQFESTVESEELNFVITSLSGCFENFSQAKLALNNNLEEIFTILCNSLTKYLEELSLKTSPSEKNEIYLFIHNSIRVILSSLQEFPAELKLKLQDSQQLELLKKNSVEIIQNPDIPMDTKVNLGILFSYLARIFADYDEFLKIINKSIEIDNGLELCLRVGVINTFNQNDFNCNPFEIHNIVENISKTANLHSTEPSTLLATTRCISQFSKVILLFKLSDNVLQVLNSCTKIIFDYSFSYLEHHMESIRHISRDILRNVVKIVDKFKLPNLLDYIFLSCSSKNISISLKCILISNIAQVLGTNEIITKRYSNIFEDLFQIDNFEKDLNISNCYESLMLNSYKELSFEEWKNIWIIFLLNSAKNSNNIEILGKFENLINKAIKCEPKLIELIMHDKSIEIPLSTKLSALWTARKNGLKIENFEENILKDFSKNLRKSFLSNSDETRIMALRLLVETHKSTENLTETDCENLLVYLKYNLNCQSPSTRQKTLGLIGKALIRFDVNLAKIIQQGRHVNEFRNMHFYFIFLQKLIILLLENLFEGANFSRRSLSLQLLKQSFSILLKNNLSFDNFLPNNSINIIFLILNDTYEANKVLGVEILKILTNSKFGEFIIEESSIKNLLTSVRPTDSCTAAYYLEFYCNILDLENSKNIFNIQNQLEFPEYMPIFYCALQMTINILENGLKIAKESILNAAISNPLYGCLFVIKHLISKLDLRILAKEKLWRNFFKNLIKSCKEATEVVGPIVNSSSPEGHLPNDFSEFTEDFQTKESNSNERNHCKILSSKEIPNQENLKITPQVVLICAWRTVKEVSLILGDIVLSSPIENLLNPSENNLLKIEQVLEIGEHFKLLLSETKHRGAFEQAYVGFSKLCSRLWRVEQPELNKLPLQWLNEMIDIISKDEKINEKICATRRSAGVPFMVQALITSELQVGTTKTLNICMGHLIKICKDPDRSTEAKTHSLNILRALFRCTDLNEACGEFVADGLICAIRGYNGSTWAERNSSTLLFSALIIRIFGVQKTRDLENLNIRNKMTGRIFFLRYPKLFDFFLDELREASESIQNDERATKLHPLLLILSRLYPSSLEGTESHLNLSAFIPYVSLCSASPEMTTRFLVAKAISAFISWDVMSKRIYEILATILISTESKSKINPNYIHGLLLQIFYLLKSLTNLNETLIEDIICELLCLERKFKLNAVLLKTILDIFNEIFKKNINVILPEYEHSQLMNISTSCRYTNLSFSKYYPVFRKTFLIFQLYTYRFMPNFLDNIKKTINISDCSTFSSYSFEWTETLLNVILLIVFKDSSNYLQIIEEFECTKYETEFVQTVSSENIKVLREYIINSYNFIKNINNNINQMFENIPLELMMKKFAIFSQMRNKNDDIVIAFISGSKLYPKDVQNSIAMCVEKFLENGIFKRDVDDISLLVYLKDISQPWNCDSLRLTASKMMRHLNHLFHNSIKNKNERFIIEFSNITLCLLMDDDSDIRDNISNMILDNSLKYSNQYSDVIPSFAQQIFLETLAEDLNSLHSKDINFASNIFKNIIQGQKENDDTNGNESMEELEIFDKNEANVFAEPEKVILDCKEIFYNTFHENI